MSVFEDPQRNFIEGKWHRIKYDAWTYQDPVTVITTWCDKKATKPPYWSGSKVDLHTLTVSDRLPEGPDCAACEENAWRETYSRLMQVKP